jgi:hypothetical protein
MLRDMIHVAPERSVIALLTQSAIAALLLCSGLARGGDTQVYRTVDAQGNVVYTDRASSANAAKTTVRFHEPSTEDLAHLEEQRKAARSAENERLRQTAISNVARAQKERAEKDRQTRCDNARQYYERLQDAGRIYQLDAQGNRVYLADTEAEARRTEARTAMEAACGS